MVENSPADLVMLAGEVAVTVTREEHHQNVLAHYGQGRHVAVELAWCVVASGKYRGERAIEVRLDGYRVGELTYLMSQRYAPLVARVNAHGGRAGCEALIERDARGLQLTLRLPSETDAPTVRVAPVAPPVPVAATTSAAPKQGNTFTRHPKAWTIAAAVFAVLLVAGILGDKDKESTSPAAADATTTTTDVASSATIPPRTSTTTTTTTTTPPPPPPTTTQVAPPPVTAQPAPVEPAPQPQCDPNYSGCVPIASDVDCAGGSGNGPAYVQGPIRVIGSDIYDLDRDGNGIACE